jgi:hypothetical protein
MTATASLHGFANEYRLGEYRPLTHGLDGSRDRREFSCESIGNGVVRDARRPVRRPTGPKNGSCRKLDRRAGQLPDRLRMSHAWTAR